MHQVGADNFDSFLPQHVRLHRDVRDMVFFNRRGRFYFDQSKAAFFALQDVDRGIHAVGAK